MATNVSDAEKCVVLREHYDKYVATGQINLKGVKSVLIPQDDKFQLGKSPMKLNPLEDYRKVLTSSIKVLIKYIGFTDCDEKAEQLLAEVVDRKLSEISMQFKRTTSRRSEGLVTAFSSPIQHVLCLHGLQDVVSLRTFMDKSFRTPLAELQSKWLSVLEERNRKRKALRECGSKLSEPSDVKKVKTG